MACVQKRCARGGLHYLPVMGFITALVRQPYVARVSRQVDRRGAEHLPGFWIDQRILASGIGADNFLIWKILLQIIFRKKMPTMY